jgi:type II secretory pathway component GspD/PulD (secretin)
VNSFILAVILLPWSSTLFAADEGPVVEEPRFRVFALKHISTEQAKNILVEADLGTVSQLPADSMILVTGQPRQLLKASAILKLFDAETPVVMKAVLPASAAGKLPSNEQIATEIGNMSIGSFSNPPDGIGKDKAIIDVHNDSVVVIATAEKLATIIDAIGRSDSNGSIKQLQKEKYEVPEPVQPKIDPVAEAELERVKAEFQKIKAELNGRNGSYESTQVGADTNDSEPNGLFDKLLDSLDDAEKKIAELSPPAPNVPEPNKTPIQPEAPITPPEKKAPNEPSTALKQPIEAVKEVKEVKEVTKEVVKEVEKPDVTAVRKKPVAKKIATKLTSKREPNDVPEQVTVEVKEPNQVAPIFQEEPNAVTEVVEPNTATKVVKPTTANGPYQPDLATIGDEELTLVMPPKINVIDLLDLVGKYLNLNYMYDPTDLTGLKGEVTLVLQGPIKIKELYPLAENVLRFKGFVMSRMVNTITIVPLIKAASIDAPIVDPNDPKVQTGDVIITRIFELKHIETASAQSLLSAMKLGVSVSPIASIRTLIVTGYAYRMERIESLLDMIDKPGEQKEFRSRGLKFTTASTLATKVKTLAEQLGTVSITISVPTSTTPARPTVPGRRPTTPSRAPTRPTTPSPTAAPAKPTVYLDADERTNRILMIGLEEQLSIVEKLIETLDVEKQDLRALRLYEIQYVDAEDVRTKLSELNIISAGAGRGAATSSRAPARTPTVAGRPPTTSRIPSSRLTTPTTGAGTIQDPLTEEPQVVIIESTNSLLVNGTAEQHVQIAVIIGYVDSEQEAGGQNPYVIYPLENQEPDELAGTLEKLISETITEQSGTDSKLVKTTQKKKKIEEDIFIVRDPKSYSLIVYASKKNQLWLASLIKELDQYRPQVLLDVTLVEITRNDEFSYNLNLISSFPDLINTSGAVSGTIIEGLTSSDIINNLDSSGRDRYIDFRSAGGTGTAFYGDRHINLLLDLVQKKNFGRILARPKLLVNDNEQGTIKAEETTYIVRKESSIVPVSGDQSTTVEKTIFEDYSAGITLDITPHISKGANLRLIVSLIRSDFRITEETISQGKPPDTVTSDVQTTVTVPDGTTIILGGLERINQSKGGTKVPILGDIPLIGGLFRSAANTDNQSRLYVFVKAYILRPGEEITGASDIEVVSLKNRATFEEFEEEMQGYEDWPGIKPEPMDPLKILEADDAISLKNRSVFEKSTKAMQEGRNSTGSKSKATHPMRVIELN